MMPSFQSLPLPVRDTSTIEMSFLTESFDTLSKIVFFSLLPLKSQPNSTKGRMFITRLQPTQLINAVLVHLLPRMNSIWKRFFYPPVIHRTFLPVCLFVDSHVPALLTSSPLCAAVLGRGGAGQGALHARAGEVPEDRSLQAFQEEGPGEAEGQAEQGR